VSFLGREQEEKSLTQMLAYRICVVREQRDEERFPYRVFRAL